MGASFFGNTIPVIQATVVSAIVIAVGEWFFHKYLDKNVLNTNNYKNTDATYNK
jgi:hypothetical protein